MTLAYRVYLSACTGLLSYEPGIQSVCHCSNLQPGHDPSWGDSEVPKGRDTGLDCVTISGACQAVPSSTKEDWCHVAMLGVTSVFPTMLC